MRIYTWLNGEGFVYDVKSQRLYISLG